MEKMVEIARFQFPAEAYTLMELLKSEGIDCYLRNELTAGLMSYLDVGGARLEILEKDLPRALEVMKEGGFINPEDPEEKEALPDALIWMNRISFLQSFSLPVKMIILFLIVIITLIPVLGIGYYLSQH